VEVNHPDIDDLFADMMQEAGIGGGDDWGFGTGADGGNGLAADLDEVRGKSPKATSNSYLGEQLDPGYQDDSFCNAPDGFSTQDQLDLNDRFRTADDGQDRIQTPPAREPSPLPELPEERHAVAVSLKKKKKGKNATANPAAVSLSPELPAADADVHFQISPPMEPSPLPELPEERPAVAVALKKKKKGNNAKANAAAVPLSPELPVADADVYFQISPAMEPSPLPELPEERPAVAVALKKKKKVKKAQGAPADFLAPEQPIVNAGFEERAVLEEIKLSEEDNLEAEFKQLEAEKAELAEQEAREEARRMAEAAEEDRMGRERREDEERHMLMAIEEEIERCHYLSLKEAAEMAEQRLSTLQAELDAIEARKIVAAREAESAREQEASCRYHRIVRNR
jgi:hypothetical protein